MSRKTYDWYRARIRRLRRLMNKALINHSYWYNRLRTAYDQTLNEYTVYININHKGAETIRTRKEEDMRLIKELHIDELTNYLTHENWRGMKHVYPQAIYYLVEREHKCVFYVGRTSSPLSRMGTHVLHLGLRPFDMYVVQVLPHPLMVYEYEMRHIWHWMLKNGSLNNILCSPSAANIAYLHKHPLNLLTERIANPELEKLWSSTFRVGPYMPASSIGSFIEVFRNIRRLRGIHGNYPYPNGLDDRGNLKDVSESLTRCEAGSSMVYYFEVIDEI